MNNKNMQQMNCGNVSDLTLQERIDCPASYCVDDSPHLLCSYEGQCDGTIYECCGFDREELIIRKMMEWGT